MPAPLADVPRSASRSEPTIERGSGERASTWLTRPGSYISLGRRCGPPEPPRHPPRPGSFIYELSAARFLLALSDENIIFELEFFFNLVRLMHAPEHSGALRVQLTAGIADDHSVPEDSTHLSNPIFKASPHKQALRAV